MKELICIVCPNGCHLRVDETGGCRVTGNACPGERSTAEARYSTPPGSLRGRYVSTARPFPGVR